jgi:hypothetical protein
MTKNSRFVSFLIVSIAATTLFGCASKPIQPTYVPVTDYQSLDCNGLQAEYTRIDTYLRNGVEEPHSIFSGVGFGLGAFGGSGFGFGVVPSLTFNAGQSSSGSHTVYSRLLGQRDAVSQQAKLKGCPIAVPAVIKN